MRYAPLTHNAILGSPSPCHGHPIAYQYVRLTIYLKTRLLGGIPHLHFPLHTANSILPQDPTLGTKSNIPHYLS